MTKMIENRSQGRLRFHVASLYPLDPLVALRSE
jgi:hypothetical protein